MQVMVNPMVCHGHGVCVGIEPQVFAFFDDDSGRAYATVETVPEESLDAVRHAAQSCPEGAIIIVE